MSYRPRNTFYDIFKTSTSRSIDNHLYSYFSAVSGVVGTRDNDSSYSTAGFDYKDVRYSEALRAERQQFAIFSKNVSYGSEATKVNAAWESFCESEMNCKRVNDAYRDTASGFDTRHEEELFHAREKIASVLGDVPSLRDLQLAFGPGANTTVKNNTSILRKLDEKPTCSKSFLPLLTELWDTVPSYAFFHSGKVRVSHGELTFVPKDSQKHRAIIMEPLLNTFVQKGVGKLLKAKILKFGIDLKNQSINRERARISSVTGELATVDMSSASDNIAYAVVLDLLPLPWVEFLDQLRTSYIVYKGTPRGFSLQKYSTMGCGFTFELQSLIFFSLAYASCKVQCIKPDVTVFGDDVILPTQAYPRFCDLLHSLGFKVNLKKSFASGPFRESCGGDYIDGINIRPFYVLDKWSEARIISFLNFYEGDPLVNNELREFMLSHVSKRNLLTGPKGFGDGHLHVPDFVGDPAHRDRGFCGYHFSTFVMRAKKFSYKSFDIGCELFPTYGLPYSPEELELFEFRRPFTKTRAHELALGISREKDEMMSFKKKKDPCVMRGGSTCKKVRVYYIPD